MSHERFESCIEACQACATVCQHCATECLHEEEIENLLRCITLDRECALACDAAAQLMSIGGPHADLLCTACAEICDACADECEKHAHMEHCKECAKQCRSCAEECRKMVASMAKEGVAL